MVLLATLVSAIAILLLCVGDPKRRRTARMTGAGDGTLKRRLLGALTCLPGVALAVAGESAAFLIWLGACAVLGWLVALLFTVDGRRRAR